MCGPRPSSIVRTPSSRFREEAAVPKARLFAHVRRTVRAFRFTSGNDAPVLSNRWTSELRQFAWLSIPEGLVSKEGEPMKDKPRRDKGRYCIYAKPTDTTQPSADETVEERSGSGAGKSALRLISSPWLGGEFRTTAKAVMHNDKGNCDERERGRRKGRNAKRH